MTTLFLTNNVLPIATDPFTHRSSSKVETPVALKYSAVRIPTRKVEPTPTPNSSWLIVAIPVTSRLSTVASSNTRSPVISMFPSKNELPLTTNAVTP